MAAEMLREGLRPGQPCFWLADGNGRVRQMKLRIPLLALSRPGGGCCQQSVQSWRESLGMKELWQ